MILLLAGGASPRLLISNFLLFLDSTFNYTCCVSLPSLYPCQVNYCHLQGLVNIALENSFGIGLATVYFGLGNSSLEMRAHKPNRELSAGHSLCLKFVINQMIPYVIDLSIGNSLTIFLCFTGSRN